MALRLRVMVWLTVRVTVRIKGGSIRSRTSIEYAFSIALINHSTWPGRVGLGLGLGLGLGVALTNHSTWPGLGLGPSLR